MNAFRIVGYAVLHLLPRAALERWLRRRLSRPGYVYSPRFSGRVALFELAATLRRDARAPVALFPDYVCNIVPRALTEAGWQIEPYNCDERLEPDWDKLFARIEHGDTGLLVGASVFGSSGLLDGLAEHEKLARLRNLGVKVIADLAQDIRLASKLPDAGNDVISAIVSFNDKSFPGAMGGGILAKNNFTTPERKLDMRNCIFLYKKIILPNIRPRKRRREIKKNAFDYSLCKTFPHRFGDNYILSKLQLVCAVQGLLMLPWYEARKQRFLDRHDYLETRFASTAAYLMASRSDETAGSGRKTKRPYAIEQRPEASLRPDDLILHNKGFDDHA